MDDSDLLWPSTLERDAAIAAMCVGKFDLLKDFLERLLARYLEAATPKFNREAFIASRKSQGKPYNEALISGTQKLSEELRRPFERQAAETAAALGSLHCLLSQYDQAAVYYRQAVEIDPSNAAYKESLTKAEEWHKIHTEAVSFE